MARDMLYLRHLFAVERRFPCMAFFVHGADGL